jgi:vitellogenic carboxypeptidase-like protein
MRYAIEQGKYIDAFHIFDALLNGDLLNTTSYFYNVTGIKNYFNYLLTDEPVDQGYFIPFVTRADRRKQIHVGNLSYGSQSDTVEKNLLNDVVRIKLKSVLFNYFYFPRCKVWHGKLQL